MVGLTGVGGGSLMTPILVLIFGQSPAVAVGTDLVFSATTKLVATASFGYSRRVDWAIVGRLALGSIPGAAAIAVWFWMSHRTPGVIEHVIARALAVILAVAAVAMLLQYPLRRLGLKVTSVWMQARGARHISPDDRHRPAAGRRSYIDIGGCGSLGCCRAAGALSAAADWRSAGCDRHCACNTGNGHCRCRPTRR